MPGKLYSFFCKQQVPGNGNKLRLASIRLFARGELSMNRMPLQFAAQTLFGRGVNGNPQCKHAQNLKNMKLTTVNISGKMKNTIKLKLHRRGITMKNQALPKNEHLIMDVFWNSDTPLTGRDLKDIFTDWNYPYIVNMLTKLEEKHMIAECGTISYGTGRARKFKPAVSRSEYAAKLIASCGIKNDNIADVMVAFVKESCSHSEELYEKLNHIIEELRTRNTKDSSSHEDRT